MTTLAQDFEINDRSLTREEISEDDALTKWKAAENSFAAIDLRPTGRHGLRASMSSRSLGDLVITDWNTPDFEGVRTSRMIDSEPDSIVLVTVAEGRQVFEGVNGSIVLGPGDLALVNASQPGRVVVPSRLKKRAIRIPMTALAPYDTGRGAPKSVHFAAGQNPLSSLLHDVVSGIDNHLRDMSPLEVETTRNALLVLVAGLLRSAQAAQADEPSVLSFLRTRLEASIVDQLGDGAISVSGLAQTHNVAVRTVQRAFAETGETVRSVARRHRLAGARADLVHTTLPIARIALRWGFCDASHFGRQFRQEFSMSPGDYRDAFAVAGGNAAAPAGGQPDLRLLNNDEETSWVG